MVHDSTADGMAPDQDAWSEPIRGVAFDMDGLMVNTEELYTIVGERILGRRGKTFSHQLKKSMMGLPGNVAWQVMIDSEDLSDSISSLDAEAQDVFAELLPERLEALPGLFDLLDYLDSAGLPRCVATSSSRQFARQVLGQINALDRVDFVVTAEDVRQGKPAPDIYLEAARRLDVRSGCMLVLEDSQTGARAGVAAGACTIAVPGEHSQDHNFEAVYRQARSLADPIIRRTLQAT